MKRPVWLVITIVTLFKTVVVLALAGWLQAEAPHSAAGRQSNSAHHVKNHDSLTSDAAWRWKRCQPAHWRACMLQHQ
jgi:hypothetical protein